MIKFITYCAFAVVAVFLFYRIVLLQIDPNMFAPDNAVFAPGYMSPPMHQAPDIALRAFPRQFPPSPEEKSLGKDYFAPETPYRVLEVIFLNDEETVGVANIEEADGDTFLTAQAEVVALKPGTYFRFDRDKTGRRVDIPTILQEYDIDFTKTVYIEYIAP